MAVILVNWNGRSDCEAAMSGLRSQTLNPQELIVVDNGSTDGSREWFKEQPDVRLITNSVNCGFAVAVNQGIAATTSPLVMLCNLDVRLDPGFVKALATRLLTAADIGSAGGLLRSEVDDQTVDSAGHLLHRSGWVSNRGHGSAGHYPVAEEVFGVTAAAAMYRREMLLDVALSGEVMCEAFFAYLEDVDLDWRAQWRGWRSFLEPLATASHRRGGTGLHRTAMIERHVLANRILLLVRNAPSAWFRGSRLVGVLILIALRVGLAGLRHPSSLIGLVDCARRLGESRSARRQIMAGRRVPDSRIDSWAEPTPWRPLVRSHLR